MARESEKGLKVRRAVTAVVIVVAAATVFISAVAAQRVIRIGGSRPVGNSPSSGGQTEQPDLNAVKAIPPSPEEALQIADLIEQLGDEHLVRRDRAMSELAGYEAKALDQVREAKKHDDDEIAARCALLEEVIQSRQGELFLAARRLNLTIAELNGYLANEDVGPLLSILRSRAQAGLVALWARVLARLSARTQLFPTAELCREIEGDVGYGQALAKAARSPDVGAAANNMLMLMALMPPGDPADTVETLTQLRFSIGGAQGLESTLSQTADFRGVYTAPELLGAMDGRPDVNAKDPDGAAEVRMALALGMIERCTPEQLAGSCVPPVASMSPMLLSTWLSLLERSGLNKQIENAMLGLLSSNADTRRISITAGSYAGVSGVGDVIGVFDALPFEAQLSVLDAWWLNPREPRVTQPFLLKLLASGKPGIRTAAANLLGQYRAPSTAAGLLKAALNDADAAPAALESLAPMSDLLSTDDLKSIAAALPGSGLLTRPLLAQVLINSGNSAGLEPLITGWKKELPRNELPLAVNVLAMRPETPAGAYAASLRAVALVGNGDPDLYLLQTLDNPDLELIRALLSLSDEDGFKLLAAMAADENDSGRLAAMNALAMAGRDGDLIEDWLKRLSGEIKDELGPRIGSAVALSMTRQAEEFRRNTMQKGAAAANLGWVVQSVLMGRSKAVTFDELLAVLFDTPQSAQGWSTKWALVSRELPPKALHSLATALAFTDGRNLFYQTGLALMLADSDIDMFEVLYGDAENPQPRDILHLYNTVLLCDPEKARTVVEHAERKEDGSNFLALIISRAWLGMLPEAETARIRRGAAGSPTGLFGAIDRVQRARKGSAGALRSLLDAFGPDALRFQRGETAEARIVEQRWGSPVMNITGVGSAAYSALTSPPPLASSQLQSLFKDAAPQDWRPWWACRRALLEFDAASGKYTFAELP
ncbi:MAG: hypothetical protein H6839_15205 [Planctomycetes bacterium]|nr:hypothetical protein [Planctomycetota bacterium]